MKWWGWGDYETEFEVEDKPKFWPFVRRKLGLFEERRTPPVEIAQIVLPRPRLDEAFCKDLARHIDPCRFTTSDEVRLHRTFGKSYPNLLAARRGDFRRMPDMVVRPTSHESVCRVVELAQRHDVCIIPFGGGTNIVGGIDPLASEDRMILTMDLGDMNTVLKIDRESMTATIEAGARGPALEAALNERSLSLGHFPDSFEYSTLGGWLATRSAGMQSDAYGRIEDMAIALDVVTPAGCLTTREVPTSSAGPDLKRLVIGSEGVLGIITRATMRVHEAPKAKEYSGYLFRSFEDGVAAMHACIRGGVAPSMVRLQDWAETELAFSMKAPSSMLSQCLGWGLKSYLDRRGYQRPCLMVLGVEGKTAQVRRKRREVASILRRHGAVALGVQVGRSWSKDKYNIPYLRDFVMDRAIMCDVAETATSWANLIPLYRTTVEAVRKQFDAEQGGHGFVGCHISHTYETGACLYFTYAAKQQAGREVEQYYRYKRLVTDVFMSNGGTLTHHHAVGSEHLPWMREEVSEVGVHMLRGLKASLDPRGIMNPGKLIPQC